MDFTTKIASDCGISDEETEGSYRVTAAAAVLWVHLLFDIRIGMRYRTQCECCKAVAHTAATVAVIRPKSGVRLSKLPLTTTRQIPKNECVCAQKEQE